MMCCVSPLFGYHRYPQSLSLPEAQKRFQLGFDWQHICGQVSNALGNLSVYVTTHRSVHRPPPPGCDGCISETSAASE